MADEEKTKIEKAREFIDLAMKEAAELERLNNLRKNSGSMIEEELETLKELIKSQKELNELNAASTQLAKESQEAAKKLQEEYEYAKKFKDLDFAAQRTMQAESEAAAAKAKKDQERMLKTATKRIEKLKEIEDITESLKEIDPKIDFGDPGDTETFQKNIDKFTNSMEEAEAATLDVSGALDILSSKGGFIGQLVKDFQGFVKLSETLFKKFGQYNKTIGEIEQASTSGGTAMATMGGIAKKFGAKILKMSGSVGNFIAKIGGMSVVAALSVFSLVLGLTKLATAAVDVSRSIGSATGFGVQFGNEVNQIYANTLGAGASMKEAGDAILALANNFSAFNPKADAANEYMATTIVRLTKIGVSADASAKTMDYFTRVMGMSAEESADMTVKLATMGREMGVTSSKMISDFGAVQGRLAVFGDRGTKVFQGLASAAKATGLQMSTLVGFAGQFDQFDTAAEKAAKLNAVLDTNISTLELLNMEDDERIQYLSSQINMSVGNFESLDKYTKMYIAQAMGLQSVEEAQRMLNMTTADFAENQKSMAESAATQATLARMTSELLPLFSRLKVAFLKIVMVFKPFIDFLISLIEAFAYLASGITYLFEQISPSVSAFIKFVYAAGMALASLVAIVIMILEPTTKVAAVIAAVVFGIVSLISAIGHYMDISTEKRSPAFYEMFDYIAGAAARMGNALMAPIRGMKSLGNAFLDFFAITHKKGSPELYKIPETIGKGFESMGAGAESAGMGGLEKTLGFAANFDAGNLLSGVASVKSAVAELSNAVVDGGFIAIKTDGSATSMVAGSDDVIAKMADGKITVDVKMPEMKTPKIELHVQIDGEKLRAIIVEEIYREAGSKL